MCTWRSYSTITRGTNLTSTTLLETFRNTLVENHNITTNIIKILNKGKCIEYISTLLIPFIL